MNTAAVPPASASAADTDRDHLRASAAELISRREQRARSRGRVRTLLDAMAAEAGRYLGEAFTANDPVTGFPVALVVRSDERLPDDYEGLTPRPATDTVSRLVVEILGHTVTVEVDDAGALRATSEATGTPINRASSVRVADGAATFLVIPNTDPNERADVEVPFLRVLAELIDIAVASEARFIPEAGAV